MDDKSLEELSNEIPEDPYGNQEARYRRLINASEEEWRELNDSKHLHLTGVLFNLSSTLGNPEGFERVINLLEKLSKNELEPLYKAQRYYQLGNANLALSHNSSSGSKKLELFDDDYLIDAIGYTRAAARTDAIKELPKNRICRNYVNFANILAQTGRLPEALRWYNEALNVDSSFAMALGNRGKTKMEYALMIFEPGHTELFLHSAYNDLKKALDSSSDLVPGAANTFQSVLNRIEEYGRDEFSLETEKEFSLGDSQEEKQYKKWVLSNRLFLNPLNDISTQNFVAHDYFHLPNMRIPDGDFPYPGMYNQMKQEFASSRYLFYEGLHGDGNHFSDRGVKLPDTLDYAVYGYNTEQIKTALRLSYSIFDKIAILFNEYYDLGHKEPNFNQFWYPNAEYADELHDAFKNSGNWALNALYWLKKDFHHAISKEDEQSRIIVAHQLKSVRNAIEHDYFKVFNDDIVTEPPKRESSALGDSLYDYIGKNELIDATREMLHLSRAALFYVSFAIHYEEQQMDDEDDAGTLSFPSSEIPDHLKE